MDNPIEITLKSSEWVVKKIDKLLEEYRNCRTENAKGRILLKLRSLQQKANYESAILKELIDRNNNEGIEL